MLKGFLLKKLNIIVPLWCKLKVLFLYSNQRFENDSKKLSLQESNLSSITKQLKLKRDILNSSSSLMSFFSGKIIL